MTFFLQLKLFFSARKSKNCHFLPPRLFFPYFTCIFTLFSVYSVANWLIFGLRKKMELKKLYIYQKKPTSVSARKLKCPSLARLGTFIARLGSARLGSARLELITTNLVTFLCNDTFFFSLFKGIMFSIIKLKTCQCTTPWPTCIPTRPPTPSATPPCRSTASSGLNWATPWPTPTLWCFGRPNLGTLAIQPNVSLTSLSLLDRQNGSAR